MCLERQMLLNILSFQPQLFQCHLETPMFPYPPAQLAWLSRYGVFQAEIQIEVLPNNKIVILTMVMKHASQLQHIDIKANGAYNQTLRLEKHC